jgi:DNA gyrase/topoisomerase IV subunit B
MAPFTLFARALLAYSVHEHQEGHARRVELWVGPRAFTVQDDGRGMGLHREGYVESLMGLLAGSACPVQLHGVGLSLVACATPLMSIESRRDGYLWTQTFSWGIANGPPRREPADGSTGTRITIEVPPGSPDIEDAQVVAQVDLWRALNSELTFMVH